MCIRDRPLVASEYINSKLAPTVSNVKSEAAPNILFPFLRSWHVATLDLFDIFILSPEVGLAGSVKFKLAVNT